MEVALQRLFSTFADGWPGLGLLHPGRSVDMPTVASHVISKQALSRPSLFSLYSILCIRLWMCWVSPN